MRWMKQWVDGGEPFETTLQDVEKHLREAYRDVKTVLDELPIGQKIRNPFAYYWKEN